MLIRHAAWHHPPNRSPAFPTGPKNTSAIFVVNKDRSAHHAPVHCMAPQPRFLDPQRSRYSGVVNNFLNLTQAST